MDMDGLDGENGEWRMGGESWRRGGGVYLGDVFWTFSFLSLFALGRKDQGGLWNCEDLSF